MIYQVIQLSHDGMYAVANDYDSLSYAVAEADDRYQDDHDIIAVLVVEYETGCALRFAYVRGTFNAGLPALLPFKSLPLMVEQHNE